MLIDPQRLEGIFPDLLEAVPDALIIVDASGHIVLVNQHTETLFGYAREELLGQPIEILVPEVLRNQHVAQRDAYLAAPHWRALDTRLDLFGQRKDGSQFPVGIGLNPVRKEGALLVIATVRDMTARDLAARRLCAEHAVTGILAESGDVARAAPRIVQAICQSVGWDVGLLWTLDRQAEVLRCVDVWHAPPFKAVEFIARSRQRAFRAGIGLPGRVWLSRRPAWIADVTQDANFPRSPIAAREGLHGAYGFPIHNHTEFFGVMEFFSREILRPDDELIEMMAAISSQIAQFIERQRAEQAVRDRAREFALARQIQHGMLPRTMPVVPGFAFGGAVRFCQETGGDYYDFFPMLEPSLGIAIGDARGHGIAAALVVADTRASLRALALSGADPDRILTLTNRRLTDDLPLGEFITLFLARLDPATGSLSYCSAGHLPGYVLGEDGAVRSVLHSTAIPLGIDGTTEFPLASGVALRPNELLVLFTDGVVEAASPDGSLFGIERALSVVREHLHEKPEEIAQGLLGAVADFCGSQAPLDDMTAVIVKVDAAP